MKRSGFKKPTLEEVKEKQAKKRATRSHKMPVVKSKPRKRKTDRKKIEEALWVECRRIVRARHGDTCYTCGAQGLEGVNWQCGHGKPKGALPVRFKYDERNLRPQCMRCNIHLGGVSDIFIAKLEQELEGLEFLQEACEKTDGTWRIKQDNTMGGKDATIFLENLLDTYKLLT
jgi:hypothetical protein